MQADDVLTRIAGLIGPVVSALPGRETLLGNLTRVTLLAAPLTLLFTGPDPLGGDGGDHCMADSQKTPPTCCHCFEDSRFPEPGAFCFEVSEVHTGPEFTGYQSCTHGLGQTCPEEKDCSYGSYN
jgi:hypothetical protein